MLNLSKLARSLHTLFTDSAARAAQASGFIRRRRVLTGPSFVQALVFGWLRKPTATLEELAAGCAAAGTPVTAQALHQRFTPAAAACLLAVLREALGTLLAARPSPTGLLARFPGGVHVCDSTTVALPAEAAGRWTGCGGYGPAAALKVFAHWELTGGALRLSLKPGKQRDAAGDLPDDLPDGALRLADLGYFGLETLARDHARSVFWVSRVQPRTTVSGPDGTEEVADYMAAVTTDRIDHTVTLGRHKSVSCRLLAFRLSPEQQARRRAKVRAEAARRGLAVGKAQLVMCAWVVLVTNASAKLLSANEASDLYRVRWQVELLFKRWKSGVGGLGASRSACPARVECEIYAKLIGSLVRHWGTLLVGGWRPERSAHKAERMVAAVAAVLQSAIRAVRSLIDVLDDLKRVLEHAGRVECRKKRPATHQTLEIPPKSG